MSTEQIETYLHQMVEMRKHAAPEGWEFGSYEEFVLAKGQSFTEYGSTLRPMTPKQCFANCRKKVMAYPGKYRYVEGWAQSIIPIHHAWLIDNDGRVIDPTWGHRIGTAYFGVVFTAEEVERGFTRADYFSMIYPIASSHPLLEKGTI